MSRATVRPIARRLRPESRLACARGLIAAAICLLLPAPSFAAAKGVFDDWKPGGPRITLPKPRPVQAKLSHKDIIGMWCATGSTYIISRAALTALFPNGTRRRFPILSFAFTDSTVEVRWSLDGAARRTVFGRFGADRRSMVQFGQDRPYRRCTKPSVRTSTTTTTALNHRAILGRWCVGSVRYTIQRERMIVSTVGGQPSVYAVTGFRFTPTTVIVRWLTFQGQRRSTVFGSFSSDRRQMRAIATGQTWRRC